MRKYKIKNKADFILLQSRANLKHPNYDLHSSSSTNALLITREIQRSEMQPRVTSCFKNIVDRAVGLKIKGSLVAKKKWKTTKQFEKKHFKKSLCHDVWHGTLLHIGWNFKFYTKKCVLALENWNACFFFLIIEAKLYFKLHHYFYCIK